ncbi:MAG TPA: leucine-rich repeat domain-containing protein [Oligoflexus sp.]|uniref:leucine-rich repeat domain-containing protein n=1 Tax=Oligoflexus sp. TaxID=1971216 RepID=UPI002D3D1699|nr:leucine-rich repeat domain-containing protein [Oligoflexus sp.]HYX38592.1 leucine-rich repeat domain-containing protein [Oligoflexus sp.]
MPLRPSTASIIGGQPAPISETPYAATISLVDAQSKQAFCSGTLIASHIVLTAAHCIEKRAQANTLILFGPSAWSQERELRPIVNWSMYRPEGSKFSPNFDIAWIQFSGDAPAGVEPIEILRRESQLPEQSEMLLVGYGRTKTSCSSSDSACNGARRQTITRLKEKIHNARFKHLLLLESANGTGVCNGDSGGPAFLRKTGRWYLVGVTNGMDIVLNPRAYKTGSASCEAGSSFHTFAGAYVSWIESGTAISLPHSNDNPGRDPVEEALDAELPQDILGWCSFQNGNHEAWFTTQALLYRVIPFTPEIPKEDYRALVDCQTLANGESLSSLMARQDTLSLSGLGIDWGSVTGSDQQISDLRPLASLSNLKELSLHGHKIVDFTPLNRFAQLERLKIQKNHDFKSQKPVPVNLLAIEGLDSLQALDLSGNGEALHVSELEQLRLPKLRKLNLNHNLLKSLPDLSHFPALEEISLYGNQIKDISPLSKLSNLKMIDIRDNAVEDLTPLKTLRTLARIKARLNPIDPSLACQVLTHISAGAICETDPPQPKNFQEWCAWGDGLTAFDDWPARNTLKALFNFAGLSWIGKDCLKAESAMSSIESLDLSFPTLNKNGFARLRDIAPLATLKGLRSLDLRGNEIRSIESLGSLPALETVYLEGNPLQSTLCPLPREEGCIFHGT